MPVPSWCMDASLSPPRTREQEWAGDHPRALEPHQLARELGSPAGVLATLRVECEPDRGRRAKGDVARDPGFAERPLGHEGGQTRAVAEHRPAQRLVFPRMAVPRDRRGLIDEPV